MTVYMPCTIQTQTLNTIQVYLWASDDFRNESSVWLSFSCSSCHIVTFHTCIFHCAACSAILCGPGSHDWFPFFPPFLLLCPSLFILHPHGPQFVFALGAFVDHFWVMVVGRFIFGYVDNMRDSFNATLSHISLTLHVPFTHMLTHTSHPLTFASFPTLSLTKLAYILGLVDG